MAYQENKISESISELKVKCNEVLNYITKKISLRYDFESGAYEDLDDVFCEYKQGNILNIDLNKCKEHSDNYKNKIVNEYFDELDHLEDCENRLYDIAQGLDNLEKQITPFSPFCEESQ